jgi:hypothetical protein
MRPPIKNPVAECALAECALAESAFAESALAECTFAESALAESAENGYQYVYFVLFTVSESEMARVDIF